jgi:RimJ/RimL family protein N-acetyltransferase
VGRALARHAREELGLRRLIALIDPENAASARVATKIGMSFEKNSQRPDGKVRQVYALDIGADQAAASEER